jgi:hypothetical protein
MGISFQFRDPATRSFSLAESYPLRAPVLSGRSAKSTAFPDRMTIISAL